jgi:hypothetical protein
MNILFVVTGTKLSKNSKAIILTLKKLGQKVFVKLLDKKDLKKPKKAKFDLLVAEVSKESTNLGYKIAQALSQKIPVLGLYPDSLDFSQIPTSIKNDNSGNLTLKSYNKANLKKTLKDYLSSLKKERETRFNFILPAELIDYLEWIPFQKKKSKSAFIRDLIREEMEKDEKYQAFLKKK